MIGMILVLMSTYAYVAIGVAMPASFHIGRLICLALEIGRAHV